MQKLPIWIFSYPYSQKCVITIHKFSNYFDSAFVLQGAKTGKDNGYTILLDVESFDYKFFKEGSEGLKVALVHHLGRFPIKIRSCAKEKHWDENFIQSKVI